MQLSGTISLLQAQALSGSRERTMIQLKQAKVKHWVCAQLARKIECIDKACLLYDREQTNEVRTHLGLEVG